MLTTRSVLLAIVTVAILSIVTAIFTFVFNDPSQSTFAKNSYGTRTSGYRAVYDLLDALEFKTERSLIPEVKKDDLDVSYVLWNPREVLVQIEPVYLDVLSQWVRDGGRLVVAPSLKSKHADEADIQQSSSDIPDHTSIYLLEKLGLSGISIQKVSSEGEAAINEQAFDYAEQDKEDSISSFKELFEVKERPTKIYSISFEGEWKYLDAQAKRVVLHDEQKWEIVYGDIKPLAQSTITDPHDVTHTLAAAFSLGKGQIVIVSNSSLASNGLLGNADNSILLTHLLTGGRHRVIFDGFYHGLTVRGNALWLLTKLPYAMMMTSILAVAGFWVWRQAIFLGPSREEKHVSRRTLNEYIDAMSRFILKGRQSPKYVLSEVRDGVLWSYCKTLGLPPQQQDAAIIIGLLSRRQPIQASQLESALKNANAVLLNPHAKNNEIVQATRKVSDCLST